MSQAVYICIRCFAQQLRIHVVEPDATSHYQASGRLPCEYLIEFSLDKVKHILSIRRFKAKSPDE